jgi:hypothetical protein
VASNPVDSNRAVKVSLAAKVSQADRVHLVASNPAGRVNRAVRVSLVARVSQAGRVHRADRASLVARVSQADRVHLVASNPAGRASNLRIRRGRARSPAGRGRAVLLRPPGRRRRRPRAGPPTRGSSRATGWRPA